MGHGYESGRGSTKLNQIKPLRFYFYCQFFSPTPLLSHTHTERWEKTKGERGKPLFHSPLLLSPPSPTHKHLTHTSIWLHCRGGMTHAQALSPVLCNRIRLLLASRGQQTLQRSSAAGNSPGIATAWGNRAGFITWLMTEPTFFTS